MGNLDSQTSTMLKNDDGRRLPDEIWGQMEPLCRLVSRPTDPLAEDGK